MNLVLKFDFEKLEKFGFQKMILDLLFGSFRHFFLEYDDIDRAKVSGFLTASNALAVLGTSMMMMVMVIVIVMVMVMELFFKKST